jgi:hypothetical protein
MCLYAYIYMYIYIYTHLYVYINICTYIPYSYESCSVHRILPPYFGFRQNFLFYFFSFFIVFTFYFFVFPLLSLFFCIHKSYIVNQPTVHCEDIAPTIAISVALIQSFNSAPSVPPTQIGPGAGPKYESIAALYACWGNIVTGSVTRKL